MCRIAHLLAGMRCAEVASSHACLDDVQQHPPEAWRMTPKAAGQAGELHGMY